MLTKLRIVYIAHSISSDWNNGNAHFLRGLMRAMVALGHDVTILESENSWSSSNLRSENLGEESIEGFRDTFPELQLGSIPRDNEFEDPLWTKYLQGAQIVILHEWNTPVLAQRLLALRELIGYRLLFHDTHHRASSSPDQIGSFGLMKFDGVIAFGEALRTIYRDNFGIKSVWTLHEAADITVFQPKHDEAFTTDLVWIGNWGEGERIKELHEFLLCPAEKLANKVSFQVYGVRYPEEGLRSLTQSSIAYGGYLPNLKAPVVYGQSRLTIHVPRQQYITAMRGIPTIRVFEALASGIPLISAPWDDCETLFRPQDMQMVSSCSEMIAAIKELLDDPARAAAQAQSGLDTILARHTCDHRAVELTSICQELLA